MTTKSLHEQIADLKRAIEAQEGMRSVLGDSVVETTLTVLRDQLNELERQATQQDAATLVNRLWIRADRAIQEYGGHIDKHIGDAIRRSTYLACV